ncbi:uncharacterized protein LOC130636242 [Hydractinia symbiolongicarpus]|uniref:uncharacterized protein LOC130636242 n=1 Tax=Hydractinia symbiolongicarpus TaxID=13093 RepID=UPI00254DE680|nr:uncharacterized protein LOC130636242 [Hydractinia symbiolongicarpus]
METESQETHKRFKEWLEIEMSKKNSSIISEDTYSMIVCFLKKGRSSDTPPHIIRRVRRKNFAIMNYPTLNLHDILCVPGENVRAFQFVACNSVDAIVFILGVGGACSLCFIFVFS